MAESEIEQKSFSTNAAPQSASATPTVINLQVGESNFFTTRYTLSGSGYLDSITSGRWEETKQADGSYFVDADPDVFKYVLRFLRHGVYPLCYDRSRGHDFAMYAAIRSQADYLAIPKLVQWLDKQAYFKALKIQRIASVVEDEKDISDMTTSDTTVRHYPSRRTRQAYVCPRRIASHYDNPRGCGKACEKAQGDADVEYEELPVLSTLIVTEKTLIQPQHLVDQEH
ncbi:MAG: hypothetical protein Q9190_000074 [Brigantiaea leucoxantha]